MFDFSIVSQWIHGLLTSVMPEWAAVLIECVLVALVIITLYAVFAIALIYFERKVCAFFQCRIGPNRVGKWGLLQVFADVFKMLTKEIINMRNSDRFLHNLAPFLVIVASMLTFSCLGFGAGALAVLFGACSLALGWYARSLLAPELVERIELTMLPWVLAGWAAYFLTGWILTEPSVRGKIVAGGLAVAVLRMYYVSLVPESYNGFLPVLAAITVSLASFTWLSVLRFKAGAED